MKKTRLRVKRCRCKQCGKKIQSFSGYCRKHSPIIGKYERTTEHRTQMAAIFKGRKVPWMEGKKRPEHSAMLKRWWSERPEERERFRKRGKELAADPVYLQLLSDLLSGKNNPNWHDGLSAKKYRHFYKKLKDKIRERDNYTCQLCGITENKLPYALSINHINFDKQDSREENLNTLCKSCNTKINFDRERWTAFFQEQMTQRLATILAK